MWSLIRTSSKNRTPAHGSAACTGSYWTIMSPISLNRSTHLTSLPNVSRSMMFSPLPSFRLYCHCLTLHSFSACLVSCSRILIVDSLSVRANSMACCSSFLTSWRRAPTSLRSALTQINAVFSTKLVIKGIRWWDIHGMEDLSVLWRLPRLRHWLGDIVRDLLRSKVIVTLCSSATG